MGLFDQCSSMFFPMRCDVYYAKESQDEYGKIQKNWQLDKTESCSFYTLGDQSNNENFSFDDKKFYRLESMLFGRLKSDVRKASTGEFYPLSHILITNIRGAGCNDELFFYETNGNYMGEPTIFEIKMAQPHIGVFSSIEYFKIQLERSDTQELNKVDIC